MSAAFDRFVAALADRVTRRRDGRVQARCPNHDDREASLSVSIGDDGRVLINCFAGCSFESIVAAVGLQPSDLFDGGRGDRPSRPESVRSNGLSLGLTLATYAREKRLPIEFLRHLGLADVSYLGAPAVRIPYRTENGQEAAVQFRFAMSGADRFRWKSGSKPLPYLLDRLKQARETGWIVLVEGPSDAQTLCFHDVPVLGIPGASSWRAEWDAYLDDFPAIYVVLEPDQGGETIYRWITRCRFRDRVKFLRCENAKDPSELFLQSRNGDEFKNRWQSAIEKASPWTVLDQQRRREAAAALWSHAAPLLQDPQLLDQIGAAMHQRGYAGDLSAPKLVYVTLTSRLLERPQNVAIVAPSGAGKNRAVDAALEFIPAEAVYVIAAGSARALVYNDEQFEHRVVVFSEADSIPEDGPAASAIRSIASDNKMVYEVVEKNARTGKHETRRIEKEGPTGLITTSIKSLGTQMGTRLLEMTVRDDENQTRLVMRAHATSVQPRKGSRLDLEPFLALQRWLAAGGVRQVAIPFADILAERVPAGAVRMRRDFRQLLTTVQAVALLYQCQRARTPEGWIEATLEDYGVARELLAPVFNSLAAEQVTPAIRATVEAVRDGEEVSESKLGRRLNLSKSTVSYRVHRALEGGWLVNHETRKGHAAKLSRGAELPDEVSALPTAEEIRVVFESSNPFGMNTPSSPAPDESRSETGPAAENTVEREVFDL